MVLTELIFSHDFNARGCGGLERNDFEMSCTSGGCGGLERTDF